MNSIKKILYPTDFSDNAGNALPYALEIARRTGSTLHLLHSIEEPYDFAPMVEEIRKGVTGKVRKLLDQLSDEIKSDKNNAEIEIQTHVQGGRPPYAILEEAESLDVDLIIMGSRGRSGFEKLFLGSTTATVIQQSDIPVLAVPSKARFTDLKKIMFTTDYHDGDLSALQLVVKFAALFDSTVHVFHASLDNDLKTDIMFRGFRELVKEKIAYEKLTFDLDTTITFYEAVADQIEEQNFSMMVMVRYDEGSSLFSKKLSRDMSYYVQIPLLVTPGSREEIYLVNEYEEESEQPIQL